MTPYSRSPHSAPATPSEGNPLVRALSKHVLPRLVGVATIAGGAAYLAPREDELARFSKDNISIRHENHVRFSLANIQVEGEHLVLTTVDGAHLSVPKRDVIFSAINDGPELFAVTFDRRAYKWPSEAELIMSKGRASEEDLGVAGHGVILSMSPDTYLELLPKLSAQ